MITLIKATLIPLMIVIVAIMYVILKEFTKDWRI